MANRNVVDRARSAFWARVNRNRNWWEMPRPLALLNLRSFRNELRDLNLYDTRAPRGNGSSGNGETPPDGVGHGRVANDDPWPDHQMKVRATSPDRTRTGTSGLPPTYINTVTHWWDGSQIYGSTEARNRQMREGEGGRMKVEN